MAKRLNNLLRGQSAALRAHSTPSLPFAVCLRRSLCRALHLDLLATVLRWFYANQIKFWRTLRELSSDDGYERYLAHHAISHPGTAPLSRSAWFVHEQRQKWSGIKRCC